MNSIKRKNNKSTKDKINCKISFRNKINSKMGIKNSFKCKVNNKINTKDKIIKSNVKHKTIS